MRPSCRSRGRSATASRWSVAALVALALWCAAGKLAAQACHPSSFARPEPARASTRPVEVAVGVAASAARFATPSYTGEYQGIALSAGAVSRYLSGDVSLPFYRIVKNGLRDQGLGDLALSLRAPLFEAEPRGLSAGLALAATLPTGSADEQLGMGHVMLMPGAYLALDLPGLTLITQLAYGRSVGAMAGGHMHMGPRPIVNPMNRSELEHAFSLSARIVEGLRALARLYGATPAWDQSGRAREILALGAQVSAGPVGVRLELELPLVGTPFDERLVLGCAGRF